MRVKQFRLFRSIDLTDYSRLPNGLISMFASFSLTSARKGYIPTFLHELFHARTKTHSFYFRTFVGRNLTNIAAH